MRRCFRKCAIALLKCPLEANVFVDIFSVFCLFFVVTGRQKLDITFKSNGSIKSMPADQLHFIKLKNCFIYVPCLGTRQQNWLKPLWALNMKIEFYQRQNVLPNNSNGFVNLHSRLFSRLNLGWIRNTQRLNPTSKSNIKAELLERGASMWF